MFGNIVVIELVFLRSNVISSNFTNTRSNILRIIFQGVIYFFCMVCGLTIAHDLWINSLRISHDVARYPHNLKKNRIPIKWEYILFTLIYWKIEQLNNCIEDKDKMRSLALLFHKILNAHTRRQVLF